MNDDFYLDDEAVNDIDGSDTREINEKYDCREGSEAETNMPFKPNSAEEWAEKY